MTVPRPHVVFDPAQRFGQPNVGGVSVVAVADTAWVEGVDVAADVYDLRREDVIVACWYAGLYGLPGARSRRAQPEWRRRWGDWAKTADPLLWSSSYGEIPDPPMHDD